MKKNGFTLAELLITLALIGVIAALTLPTLFTDTTMAQVGPKLAKAVAMFEQANELMLNEKTSDSLSDAGLDNETSHSNALLNNLKGSIKVAANTTSHNYTYLSKDGIEYTVHFGATGANNSYNLTSGNLGAHTQGLGLVIVDINGGTSPNTLATDQFRFSLWKDGSLRPQGGYNWDGKGANSTTWQTNCKVNETPAHRAYCAGHVFENNMKVLYK